jgi:GDPmannose 4,6-dehydratase
MLQQPEPDDFVLATGKTHSIQELLEKAFECVGLNWEKYVEIDPKLIRPAEVDHLCGDATKAREKLGWQPKVSFDELIKMMVEADLEVVQRAESGHAGAAVRNGR